MGATVVPESPAVPANGGIYLRTQLSVVNIPICPVKRIGQTDF